MDMTITSSAFARDGSIPKLYTCEGKNISPPLAWSGVPMGAKSLVLIVDDPDAPDPAAPRMTWVHWLLYNLPDHRSKNCFAWGKLRIQLDPDSPIKGVEFQERVYVSIYDPRTDTMLQFSVPVESVEFEENALSEQND